MRDRGPVFRAILFVLNGFGLIYGSCYTYMTTGTVRYIEDYGVWAKVIPDARHDLLQRFSSKLL